MDRYFIDSSALVKRYHRETGSAEVDSLFIDANNRFIVSRLALVEVHSTLARLVREGAVDAADFSVVVSRLEQDVVDGVLTVAALSSQRLAGACAFLRTHGLTHNVRTLDAIHLATAIALHSRTRMTAFVAADKKLLTVAMACGLAVLDVG